MFMKLYAHPFASYCQGDGCSRGLPLRERWTRRGHIVHSSRSVRPTVTDHLGGKLPPIASW